MEMHVCSGKTRVVVAMSGGVDSSVAAAILREQGCDVHGVTLRMHAGSDSAAEEARRVADQLGIAHEVRDCTEVFEREIIEYFVAEYLEGRTPNPCVRCNPLIKFGTLFAVADEIGADLAATGHYARVERRNGRMTIRRAQWLPKDQSYVLAGLSQEQLSRAVFPLGSTRKEETRERARALGLASAERAESQEICFITWRDLPSRTLALRLEEERLEARGIGDWGLGIGDCDSESTLAFPPLASSLSSSSLQEAASCRPAADTEAASCRPAADPCNDYRAFIAARVGPPTPGPILSMKGEVLGQHSGLLNYTVGQRRGLGISDPRPHYVVALDPRRNAVIAGHDEDTLRDTLETGPVNWVGLARQTEPFACMVQIRYLHRAAPATATPAGERLHVRFRTAQRAVTPGQFAVLYDEEGYVLAAGSIRQPSLDAE
jgi:tRNA-specific 2-thiouridylase